MRRIIQPRFTEDQVLEAGLATVERALATIHSETESDEYAFDEYWYPRLKKHLLKLDHDAQKTAEKCLQQRLSGIQIRGEESTLQRLKDGLSALLDALDGSDLLKRKLGNWCSALTIFEAGTAKIITAVVGMPNKEIYFTKYSDPNAAYVRTPSTNGKYTVAEVVMERREVALKDAAIAFYGQKPAKLLSFTTAKPKVARWLTRMSNEMNKTKNQQGCPKMRIYNLAGIPLMINVVEGYLDAVIEITGQRCHDVVPGFVVALRAGAILRDLANKNITEQEIAARLQDPSHKFSYVLACNEKLASDLVELLQPTIASVTG